MHAKQTMAVLMRFEDVGGVESVQYNITFIYITNDVTPRMRCVIVPNCCQKREWTAELRQSRWTAELDNLEWTAETTI
jgi:hypothetical protein